MIRDKITLFKMALPAKFNDVVNSQVPVGNSVINLKDHLVANGESALLSASTWSIQVRSIAGGNIRIFFNGDEPTSALGMFLTPLQVITVYTTPENISFIRAGGSDGAVDIQPGKLVSGFPG